MSTHGDTFRYLAGASRVAFLICYSQLRANGPPLRLTLVIIMGVGIGENVCKYSAHFYVTVQ
jgi:hypothetical protein